MTFELAVRLTEALLGFAFIIQSAEHLSLSQGVRTRALFGIRLVLSVLLMAGIAPVVSCIALLVTTLLMLRRFQGPYNGGSDRMGSLILICLVLTHSLPDPLWKTYAFGYLSIQLILSYFISGWVKVVNRDWRTGRALQDVFLFSAYPVTDVLRDLAKRPRLLWALSWSVMLLELAFPFALFWPWTLIGFLILAGLFHLSNACFFGLNRFFWTWLAAYPSLLWFQDRFIL